MINKYYSLSTGKSFTAFTMCHDILVQVAIVAGTHMKRKVASLNTSLRSRVDRTSPYLKTVMPNGRLWEFICSKPMSNLELYTQWMATDHPLIHRDSEPQMYSKWLDWNGTHKGTIRNIVKGLLSKGTVGSNYLPALGLVRIQFMHSEGWSYLYEKTIKK